MTAVMENKLELYENKISDIEKSINTAEEKRTKLTERRKRIALSATSGDLKAERELARITQEAVAIDAEIENLNFALTAAHDSLGKAHDKISKDKADEQKDRVKELAQLRLKAAKVVDDKFVELMNALRTHKEIAMQMGSLPGVNAGYPLKSAINRSASYHQLNEFVELFRGAVSKVHFKSFHDLDLGSMQARRIDA